MKRRTENKTRSLFQKAAPKVEQLQIPMDMGPGVFYTVDNTYWCFAEDVMENQTVEVIPYNLPTYFTVHQFRVGKNIVGYRFSGDNIHNGGVFLRMTISDEPAVSFRLVCRTRNLVIYDYPNAGALVVIPHLGDRIRDIIMEQ